MNNEQHHPSSEEPRVAVLTGDRLCVRCGFNLHGQTIVRERHYNMLSVRCPECSTVASLQEYPTLGPWAHRLGLVLAAVWLGCLLGMAFFTWLTFYACAEGVAGTTTQSAAKQIGQAFLEYRADHLEPEGSGTLYAADSAWGNYASNPQFMTVDADWLISQDLATLGATSGLDRYDGRGFGLLVPMVLGSFAWGLFWAVALLHRRLAGRLIWTGVIVGAAAAFVVFSHWGSPAEWDGFGPWSTPSWWGLQASHVAARAYGLTPALVTIVLMFGGLVAGLAVGVRLTRLLVVLLLPPRLRGAWAVLWHVDGLPSPTTKPDEWLRG